MEAAPGLPDSLLSFGDAIITPFAALSTV